MQSLPKRKKKKPLLLSVEFIVMSCRLLFLVVSLLQSRYEKARRFRVAIIHGMARMAALMASTYKAYLGVGLGPLSV